jgi:hypothetical protein
MTKKIEAYSLFEFCQLVQDAVLEGYRFDFDSNDNFPTAFGSLLVAGMVLPAEVPKEDKAPKRGRPASAE